jgi:hypothetical protein
VVSRTRAALTLCGRAVGPGAVWLFLMWNILKFVVAAALAITGVQLLLGKTLRVRGARLRTVHYVQLITALHG